MNTVRVRTDHVLYDNDIVKKFVVATMVWGAVAFLVGLIAALQLAYFKFNLGLEWVTFGRLRPLHTNAAVFAFAGNAIFAGIYYSTQRLCKTRLFSDLLSSVHFWGWQLIILLAAVTLPLGLSAGKEYAELEWPIDILITLIWVVFAVNFFGTLAKRKEKHMYVSIWFYIATIVTVAVLHILNSIAIPVSLFKSYPVWAGVQDALIQWWYGHNAVAFFLTTPFLGLMYYFVPKAVQRPVYSYRLSIVHFWSLVFIYIWAGPHHLLYTSLPDWAQTLGVIFSIMLWAPSWGGMINGLLTIRGAWHLLRQEPIVKFFVVGITFYGMATFEGPLLSIKSISAVAHYTDWIIGHVHSGALGWNGFMTFGMIYYLVPKLWNTTLYSKSLATKHFWIGLMGIVFYYLSMVAAGITQGMMWRALTPDGQLVYPDFLETVIKIVPLYWVRVFGGTLFIIGFALMCYNIFKTIALAQKSEADQDATVVQWNEETHEKEEGHRKLESLATVFTVLTVVTILVGSVIQIYPSLNVNKYVNPAVTTTPYTPLQLAGRDIYVSEGCYVCHSQQVRKLTDDVIRFGKNGTEPSKIEDSLYDRPFQWGSKRTGPDLSFLGNRFPSSWHFHHMIDPRSMSPQSIMPSYGWLAEKNVDFLELRKKTSVLRNLGVPYDQQTVVEADLIAQKEALVIVEDLKKSNINIVGLEKKQIIALIAYMQGLGLNTQPKSNSTGGKNE